MNQNKLETICVYCGSSSGLQPEYMEAAWKIMQLDYADDFIICTGEVHTVKEFLHTAFKIVDLNPAD